MTEIQEIVVPRIKKVVSEVNGLHGAVTRNTWVTMGSAITVLGVVAVLAFNFGLGLANMENQIKKNTEAVNQNTLLIERATYSRWYKYNMDAWIRETEQQNPDWKGDDVYHERYDPQVR